MGGFYGSIQVRSEDRDRVLPHLGALVRDGAVRVLCGPAIDGWVGVYPSGNGQDERVAAALAAAWPGELFYLAVLDDEVLVYRYFRGGRRRDAYWSRPEHLDDRDRETHELEAGQPEAYAHLIGGEVERARALLDRSDRARPRFEIERLLALAKLLGISNAGTAYEYLENGERDDVRGWRHFVHLPDRAEERSAAKRAKAERDEEHKRLIASGVLLAAAEVRDRSLVAPIEVTVRGRPTLVFFEEPPRVGVAHADGSSARVTSKADSIEVTHSDGQRMATLLAGGETIHHLGFSDEGRWLLCCTSKGVRVAAWSEVRETSDGAPIRWRYAFDVPARDLAPNPSHGHVYDAVHDPAGDRVLFGGRDGRVRTMSLLDGHVGELLALHERPAVLRIKLLDGATLATLAQPGFPVMRANGPKPLLHVWDHATLQERPELGSRPTEPALETRAPDPVPEARAPDRVLEARAPEPPASDDDAGPLQIERVIARLRATHANAPKEIRLERLRGDDWPDTQSREELVTPLLNAGFGASERYIVPALERMQVQFFAHAELCIAGTLLKTLDYGTTLTLATEACDGTSFAFSNRPEPGLEPPPGRVVRYAHRAGADELLALVLQHRPIRPRLSMTVDELPGRFERAYAKHHEWREEHGFGVAEAVRLLLARARLHHG